MSVDKLALITVLSAQCLLVTCPLISSSLLSSLPHPVTCHWSAPGQRGGGYLEDAH